MIASGKPFNPSTTAIRMSLTPLALSTLMILSQNLASSVCSIQRPGTSFSPSALKHDLNGLVFYETLFADFHPQGIEKNNRINRDRAAGSGIRGRTPSVTWEIRSGETSIP